MDGSTVTVSSSTRPHCTRCGQFLDKVPDNGFGWCATCQTWAQMGVVAQPVPTVAPNPWWTVPPGWLVPTVGQMPCGQPGLSMPFCATVPDREAR